MSDSPINVDQSTVEKSRFNLSEWALNHQTLVLYIMLMLTVAGLLAYSKLGQSEDPPFTFKVMLIRTSWLGAGAVRSSSKSPISSRKNCKKCRI